MRQSDPLSGWHTQLGVARFAALVLLYMKGGKVCHLGDVARVSWGPAPLPTGGQRGRRLMHGLGP